MAGYLASVSLIGLGLGILLRSVAASIATLVGVVLILPPIAAAVLPDSWNAVLQYLPTNAAAAFTAVTAHGVNSERSGWVPGWPSSPRGPPPRVPRWSRLCDATCEPGRGWGFGSSPGECGGNSASMSEGPVPQHPPTQRGPRPRPTRSRRQHPGR